MSSRAEGWIPARRKLLLLLLVTVLGLLVVADVAARSVMESQLRDRVEAAAEPEGATRARISSFPFLPRLLQSGDVSRVRVSAEGVTVEGLTLARVSVDLQDVTLDRDRLLSERTIVLTELRQGTAEAEVTQEEVSDRLGVPVTLEDGRAQVEVAGESVTARASVDDNILRVSVEGFPLPTLRIPKLPLVPCVADVRIVPGRVRLSCSVDEIPAELAGRPLGEVELQEAGEECCYQPAEPGSPLNGPTTLEVIQPP